MITYTGLVDELLRSSGRRRRSNRNRNQGKGKGHSGPEQSGKNNQQNGEGPTSSSSQ